MYFWNKTLHISDSFSVHHQEIFTVNITMVYVIHVTFTACEQDQDGDALISEIYFWNELYMFRTVSLSIVRRFSLYTQQWCMSYRLHLQHANRIRTELRPDPARKLSANLYDIYHCCVYSEKLLMMVRETFRRM